MNVEFEVVLDELGIDYEIKGAEAQGLCPMHFVRTGKQDNSPSWWFNLDTGEHICFSCHYKGGVLSLICDIKEFHNTIWGEKEQDYTAAKLWLSSISEVSPDRLASSLASLTVTKEIVEPQVDMSEARLAVFVDPPLDKLQQRNITLESAQKYEIMWDANSRSWIFPLREPHSGTLLGWQEKGTESRTFLNQPRGLVKSTTLFGATQIREDVAYVVESPLDCARFYSAGFPGAVAICGSTMSQQQIKLISSVGRVIAAFDNPKVDDAGMKASAQIASLALKYGINLSFFNYGDSGKKDPGDLTDAQIKWGISNAISSLYGPKAYV
jgi:hypothetical protein